MDGLYSTMPQSPLDCARRRNISALEVFEWVFPLNKSNTVTPADALGLIIAVSSGLAEVSRRVASFPLNRYSAGIWCVKKRDAGIRELAVIHSAKSRR